MNSDLIRKYNVPAPRYTSYPTVPFWDVDRFFSDGWIHTVEKSFVERNQEEGISLYIHLPFCEKLCTFCGCNKRITKNHEVEEPYIQAVLKEWGMYVSQFGEKPRISGIHLGGGSPTFFHPLHLKQLMEGIFKLAEVHPDAHFSFEANPNTAQKAHFEVLADHGFDRVSFGIQDFDPLVQETINRIQPFEQVQKVQQWAIEAGFKGINHDIVFGLPFQTPQSIEDTFDKVEVLRPDRIAYYSYAHVPWIKGNGQRKFSEKDLPRDAEKRKLYDIGYQRLLDLGYREIGMDHFALPEDGLYQAMVNGRLHRNFMGYIEQPSRLLIGLGVSSISDSWYGLAQNEKKLEDYMDRIEEGEIPVYRGHLLTKEDLIVREHIQNLMCHWETQWKGLKGFAPIEEARERWKELEQDGLIQLGEEEVIVKEAGKPFIRNICMALDAHMWRKKSEARLFSMAI